MRERTSLVCLGLLAGCFDPSAASEPFASSGGDTQGASQATAVSSPEVEGSTTKAGAGTLGSSGTTGSPVDPPSTGSSGTTSGSTGSEGNADGGTTQADAGDSGHEACSRCAPTTPAEWEGPLIVATGEGLPSCPAGFSGSVTTGFTDFAVEPSSCGCSCTPQATCGDEISLYTFAATGPACAGSGSTLTRQGAGVCHDVPASVNTHRLYFVRGTEAGCVETATESFPEPTMTGARICGGQPEGGSCDGGGACLAPIPDRFEQAVCVSRAGEHPCPDGFGDRRIVHTSVRDTRDCSTCSCTAENVGCRSPVHQYSEPGCEGTQHSFASPGCDLVNFLLASFRFDEPFVTGTCTPAAVQPTGEATATGPLTLCCADSP